MFRSTRFGIALFLIISSCNLLLNNVYAESVQNSEQLTEKSAAESQAKKLSFRTIYDRIYAGKANMEMVRLALTSKDTTKLVNTMHALYAMKWHVGVYKLLYTMWELDPEKTKPEININWEAIKQPPVRIALASTINRIDTIKAKEFRDYIRTFKYDDSELNRGQVLVALGLNGDPADVPYLEEMADSDSRYLTQISVSSLAFMENETAKNSLITLAKKHYNTPRGKLILGVLDRAYDVVPVTKEEAETESRVN